MSLWKDYFEEKGLVVVENEKGLMSAYIVGEVIMVDNFYVKPEYRGTRSALQITLQLIHQAKERGCKSFCAEIYKSDPMYSYIRRLHAHFGMVVVEDTEYKTVTCKEI